MNRHANLSNPGIFATAMAAIACLALTGPVAAQRSEGAIEVHEAETSQIYPEFSHPRMTASPEELARVRDAWLEEREQMDARTARPSTSGAKGERLSGRPTQAVDSLGKLANPHTTDPTKLFRINRRNTMGTSASNLAEPAAAANGKHVMAGGNTHQEFSTDHGNTWTTIAIPAGPAATPFVCCDADVTHALGRGVTFFSWMYVNGALTDGAVRLFVYRDINAAANCTYTIRPRGLVVPDYPHIATSNKFLYLTTNEVTSGVGWTGSVVRRFNLDQMADCVKASTGIFTFTGATGVTGQRVAVPAEGATEEMAWGYLGDDDASMRVYRWRDDTAAPTSSLHTIQASVHANPDCRGGIGDFDFVEKSTAWSRQGFRMRSVFRKSTEWTAFWTVAPDRAHPQAHVHGYRFLLTEGGVTSNLGQFNIWNRKVCIAFPALADNGRGDIGVSVAAGGTLGGGGTAAQGYVGIDDDETAGKRFRKLFRTAKGDRNRSDGRFGDYFTVRTNSPCSLTFVATNYSLIADGPDPGIQDDINSRVVFFGRGRDQECLEEFKQTPTP